MVNRKPRGEGAITKRISKTCNKNTHIHTKAEPVDRFRTTITQVKDGHTNTDASVHTHQCKTILRRACSGCEDALMITE